MTAKRAIRVTQREIEALVGGALLKTVGSASQEIALKRSKLVAKKVHLPLSGIAMNYREREATPPGRSEVSTKNRPTVLFFHGISGTSEDFAKVIVDMKIPPHVRILVPEQIGHGRDIERAKSDPDNFKQPTHESMLASTSEFLDKVEAGSNCHAFGISLGGAVCYYLHKHRPDVIRRSVLVSPAILSCVDVSLIHGIKDGSNRFICFESRQDVKLLFRDLSTGRNVNNDRKKKDPVPKFFLEAIFRTSTSSVPEGHYQAMLSSLLKNVDSVCSSALGHDPTENTTCKKEIDPFLAATDVDPESHRLVMWPDKDQIVNYERGKRFFGVSMTKEGGTESSSTNTDFKTIPNCGHVFHSDGTFIFDLIRPQVKSYLLDFTSLSATQ